MDRFETFLKFIFLSLIFIIGLPVEGRADVAIDLNGIFLQDSLSTTNNPSTTKTYYDLGVGLSLYNRSPFYFGMSYIGYSSTDGDSSAVTTSWSSQDMGFFVRYYIGRNRNFSITGGYGISSTATYKLGASSSEVWTGTSYFGKATYVTELNEKLSLTLSIVYYSGNYTISRSGTSLTNIAKTKNYVLPLVGISYDF